MANTPQLGQDMGYQRDFQLWELARSVSEDADATNYRTIAACELQDRLESALTAHDLCKSAADRYQARVAELTAALLKIADEGNGTPMSSRAYVMAQLARQAIRESFSGAP